MSLFPSSYPSKKKQTVRGGITSMLCGERGCSEGDGRLETFVILGNIKYIELIFLSEEAAGMEGRVWRLIWRNTQAWSYLCLPLPMRQRASTWGAITRWELSVVGRAIFYGKKAQVDFSAPSGFAILSSRGETQETAKWIIESSFSSSHSLWGVCDAHCACMVKPPSTSPQHVVEMQSWLH